MSYIAFFAYLNVDTIYVHLPYVGEFRIPAALAFLSAFISGAIFSAFYFLADTARKSFEIKRSRKELSALMQTPDDRKQSVRSLDNSKINDNFKKDTNHDN
jgi:hypothetical protein